MRNVNKAGGVVGTIPRKYGSSGYTSYKAQKRHASTCTTLEAIGHLVSKLRLRAHIDELLKGSNKMYNR